MFVADACSCGLFLTCSEILALMLGERNTGKVVTLAYVHLINES